MDEKSVNQLAQNLTKKAIAPSKGNRTGSLPVIEVIFAEPSMRYLIKLFHFISLNQTAFLPLKNCARHHILVRYSKFCGA